MKIKHLRLHLFITLSIFILVSCTSNQAKPKLSALQASKMMWSAARVGDVKKLEWLIKMGGDVNTKDRHNSPLHIAAAGFGGNKETINLLIDNGANINARDHYDVTPLHSAAESDQVNIAKLLIERGANVNAEDRFRSTPLHKAVSYGHLATVELLLSSGAEINIESVSGSPLYLAVDKGNLEIFEALITAGANVNLGKTSTSSTPLHLAIKKRNSYISRKLISIGSNVNVIDISFETPVSLAAGLGLVEIFELLITKNVDINAKNKIGKQPIHKAVKGGHKRIVELLIKNGVNINTKIPVRKFMRITQDGFQGYGVSGGDTPLHLAAQYGQTDIAQFLVSNGADVTVKLPKGTSLNVNSKLVDTSGSTPLDLAKLMGHQGIVRLLDRE